MIRYSKSNQLQKEGQEMKRTFLSEQDNKIYDRIIKIMEIENDAEMQTYLETWIDEIGIDEVFDKIIRIHSLNLY